MTVNILKRIASVGITVITLNDMVIASENMPDDENSSISPGKRDHDNSEFGNLAAPVKKHRNAALTPPVIVIMRENKYGIQNRPFIPQNFVSLDEVRTMSGAHTKSLSETTMNLDKLENKIKQQSSFYFGLNHPSEMELSQIQTHVMRNLNFSVRVVMGKDADYNDPLKIRGLPLFEALIKQNDLARGCPLLENTNTGLMNAQRKFLALKFWMHTYFTKALEDRTNNTLGPFFWKLDKVSNKFAAHIEIIENYFAFVQKLETDAMKSWPTIKGRQSQEAQEFKTHFDAFTQHNLVLGVISKLRDTFVAYQYLTGSNADIIRMDMLALTKETITPYDLPNLCQMSSVNNLDVFLKAYLVQDCRFLWGFRESNFTLADLSNKSGLITQIRNSFDSIPADTINTYFEKIEAANNGNYNLDQAIDYSITVFNELQNLNNAINRDLYGQEDEETSAIIDIYDAGQYAYSNFRFLLLSNAPLLEDDSIEGLKMIIRSAALCMAWQDSLVRYNQENRPSSSLPTFLQTGRL